VGVAGEAGDNGEVGGSAAGLDPAERGGVGVLSSAALRRPGDLRTVRSVGVVGLSSALGETGDIG
jgi:hypothetical protein